MQARRAAWPLVALLVACASSPTPVPATVTVHDTAVSQEWTVTSRYRREGDMYVRGSRKVPVAVIVLLQELARDAPTTLDDLPYEIRLDSDQIRSKRSFIHAAAVRGAVHPTWMPEELNALLDVDAVRRVALDHLVDDSGKDRNDSTLTVTIGGMALETASDVAWAQPWRVTEGGVTRTVYSLEISKLVSLLADPRGHTAQYLDGTRWWREGFWHAAEVWRPYLGESINRHHALRATRALAGFDEARARFTIRLSRYDDRDALLHTVVAATDGGLVDHASFYNPMENGRLQFDWKDFLERFDALSGAARRIPFFRTWKAAGPNRTLRCAVVGRRAHDRVTPLNFLAPAWKHSGLKGELEFAIKLYIERDYVGTYYFSTEATGCLVDPTKDGVHGPFAGTTYTVISPDGEPR